MERLIPDEDSGYNAGQVLLERAAARGGARVLRCETRDCSGSELVARVIGFQRGLDASGLSAGDRVLVVLRDTPAFHAAFLGAIRGGFIPVPVSTLAPPADLAFIARDAGARAVVVDSALPREQREPSLFPESAVLSVNRDWELEGADAAGPGEPEAAATRAADACFWLYTSGTTGKPKGVIHRHLDLAATAELVGAGVFGVGPGDRVLSAPKLFFAYGLGNSLTLPLFLGAEAVLWPERPTPEAMFRLWRDEDPTLFFAVPTLFAAMLAHPELPKTAGRIRLCLSAGEALAASLFERFRDRFGVEILDHLGTTEMLYSIISNRPGEARPGSSGIVIPGYEARIIDEEGADVPDGQSGTLVVGGPPAARAYHDRPDETARTMFAPGWIRTGDSYRRDADGFYYSMGRSDDLIKVSGQYVAPLEVEATLAAHPKVVESAVVGQRDEHGLTKPRAFVVLVPGATAGPGLAAELQEFVKRTIAPHKYPRSIEFVDELPKTATGKIRRFLLRDRP